MEIFMKKRPAREKLPIGRPQKWTQEFMLMVAKKVVDQGMTYRDASKTFEVSSGALSKWVRNYKQGNLGPLDAKHLQESQASKVFRLESELKELKGEIGELYLENLMLKKALIHSRQVKRENSSVITSENLGQFQKAAE
jgi:transposase-like protein